MSLSSKIIYVKFLAQSSDLDRVTNYYFGDSSGKKLPSGAHSKFWQEGEA